MIISIIIGLVTFIIILFIACVPYVIYDLEEDCIEHEHYYSETYDFEFLWFFMIDVFWCPICNYRRIMCPIKIRLKTKDE